MGVSQLHMPVKYWSLCSVRVKADMNTQATVVRGQDEARHNILTASVSITMNLGASSRRSSPMWPSFLPMGDIALSEMSAWWPFILRQCWPILDRLQNGYSSMKLPRHRSSSFETSAWWIPGKDSSEEVTPEASLERRRRSRSVD